MEAPRILPHYINTGYTQWVAKLSLIEGIPFAMSPAPRPKHQHIAKALSAELHFAQKKCKACHVYDPIDYKISKYSITQSDVLVCSPIEQAFPDRAPELSVEVLSPSIASKDRIYKLNAYQRQGVSNYLIEGVADETVEVLILRNGHYEAAAGGHSFQRTFTSNNDCEANIDFNEIR